MKKIQRIYISRTSHRSDLSMDAEDSSTEIAESISSSLLWILVQINKDYLESKENNIQ